LSCLMIMNIGNLAFSSV